MLHRLKETQRCKFGAGRRKKPKPFPSLHKPTAWSSTHREQQTQGAAHKRRVIAQDSSYKHGNRGYDSCLACCYDQIPEVKQLLMEETPILARGMEAYSYLSGSKAERSGWIQSLSYMTHKHQFYSLAFTQ